jgi:hypothetical protein
MHVLNVSFNDQNFGIVTKCLHGTFLLFYKSKFLLSEQNLYLLTWRITNYKAQQTRSIQISGLVFLHK